MISRKLEIFFYKLLLGCRENGKIRTLKVKGFGIIYDEEDVHDKNFGLVQMGVKSWNFASTCFLRCRFKKTRWVSCIFLGEYFSIGRRFVTITTSPADQAMGKAMFGREKFLLFELHACRVQ